MVAAADAVHAFVTSRCCVLTIVEMSCIYEPLLCVCGLSPSGRLVGFMSYIVWMVDCTIVCTYIV